MSICLCCLWYSIMCVWISYVSYVFQHPNILATQRYSIVWMSRSAHSIHEQLKEELLPRTDRYRSMQKNNEIPETNESRIVVPCLVKTFGFKANQYKSNRKYLESVITEKDFNGFISRGIVLNSQRTRLSRKRSSANRGNRTSHSLRSYQSYCGFPYWSQPLPSFCWLCACTLTWIKPWHNRSRLCPLFSSVRLDSSLACVRYFFTMPSTSLWTTRTSSWIDSEHSLPNKTEPNSSSIIRISLSGGYRTTFFGCSSI